MYKSEILVYHGTDYQAAQQIKDGCFKTKQNLRHWLGNGVYFYLDKDLAVWWASRPSQRFGSTITNPAIITAKLNLSAGNVLDLRSLKDYRQIAKWYYEFSEIVCSYCANEEIIDSEKLRCSFFDYLMKKKDIDIIIGSFTKKQPYRDDPEIEYLEGVDLGYPEVQICVREDRQKTIIKIMSIELLDSKESCI